MDKALFCFEFFIENIRQFNYSNCVQIDFKLADYEWQSIIQDDWKSVGRRCYLVNDSDFLLKIKNNKLKIRALCVDGSLHSCQISLNSFYLNQSIAYCKGAINLFPSPEASSTLQLLVIIRLYDIDKDQPISISRSVIKCDQQIQTTVVCNYKNIQTFVSTRNAAIQTKGKTFRSVSTQVTEKRLKKLDEAIQCSNLILNRNDYEKIISNIFSRIIAKNSFTSDFLIIYYFSECD
ncbi:unnamed protein product [Dracunculus medinensis]|uniref:ZP domain-containing protein n=1 Tax=Dracunculus medinensis TaxID=318479 RepID=A0A0N4UKX7_DRAME|nr:unnamed protein product [Dracunculus medinensis]